MDNQAFCRLMLLCGTYQLSVLCNIIHTGKSDRALLKEKS